DVGHAKFTGRTSVCMATSGPDAVHPLNGHYDAKRDRVPVVAIIGRTDRADIGGCSQQECRLRCRAEDFAAECGRPVMSPHHVPNALDRSIRVAETQRAPTAVIIPLDVQEAEYSPPTHDFKMVPSSLGYSPAATVLHDEEALDRAAAVLNEGSKVAILAG